MSRPMIDTGIKCCAICSKSFFRKRYVSGRCEEPVQFKDRATCGDETCELDYKSIMQKKSYNKKHPEKLKEFKKADAIDVFLSMSFSKLNSVRYKKNER